VRVALTGASGSIASYVLRELLAHGHEPVSAGRTPPVADVPHLEASLGDSASLARAFAGAEAVVHLAAVTSPYRAPAEELMEVNVAATWRVLEAAVAAGARKLVFASSGAATGFSFPVEDKTPRYLPLDEEHPCEPDDTYGASKLVGEELCARWSRAHGLTTVSLRINSNWYVDRPGAEAALLGRWGRAFSIDELWSRYRLQLDLPERPRSADTPPLPRDLLWAVTDARDMATAFRLALEGDAAGVFHVNGSDTCSLEPSAELVERFYPDVPVRGTLFGHATLVSHAKATAELDYEPRHTWRESDFAAWLAAARG
jgi:nucleoside-diphosphate-sugar epimerase